MSTDSEKQKDEIVALESIYNTEEFSYHQENDQYECTLKAYVTLPKDYFFSYRDTRNPDEPVEKVVISHLPPLSLFVTLPLNYPSESAPKLTLVCSWLSRYVVAKLCRKLDQLWRENKGLEILFTWMAFLNDQTLEFLNIKNGLEINYAYTLYKMTLEQSQDDKNVGETTEADADTSNGSNSKDLEHNKAGVNPTVRKTSHERIPTEKRGKKFKRHKKFLDQRAIFDRANGRNPVQMLVDYNFNRKQIEFKRNFYSCKICFLDKLGDHCIRFIPCFHVFCKECIMAYLVMRIKEGNVKDICCPEDNCPSEATPGQVKDLVSPELFARYDTMLLSVTLDTMTDIVYCPRPHCQYPVSRELDDKMASCAACQYSFCIQCKMGYHGIEPCKLTAEKLKLVSRYENAADAEKKELGERYGKKQLQALLEDTMSENWIEANTNYCPRCWVAIEKDDGCNKMACQRCKTYFCWLCKEILRKDVPYEHFRRPDSKCYKKLFNDVVPEDQEDEMDNLELQALNLDDDSSDED